MWKHAIRVHLDDIEPGDLYLFLETEDRPRSFFIIIDYRYDEKVDESFITLLDWEQGSVKVHEQPCFCDTMLMTEPVIVYRDGEEIQRYGC